MEFREHTIEYGYTYASRAIVPDESIAAEPIDAIRVYEPSTQPGNPLPHAWLDDDGERRPLMDLVSRGRFLLIAGERGQAWCRAAEQLAAHNDLPLDVVTIGHLAGDYLDPRCQWLQRREINAEGAMLVRPDRFVAWRSVRGPSDPVHQLRFALEQILNREVAA